MIDSHTHLDGQPDPDAALERARAAGVHGVLAIGYGAERIQAALDVARRHPDLVRVCAGVHPQQAAGFTSEEWEIVAELARDPQVVAIGETGFDLYRDYGTLEQQQPWFELQCELARATDRPLVIHTRAAEEHTLAALAEHASDLRVVLHCFSLTDQLDEVLERGYWCSFAGNLTYPSAQGLRDAAARIPLERLLVETDAPYLTPVPHRGERNEPAYVAHTLAVLADACGVDLDAAEQATSANAAELFGFSARSLAAAASGDAE